MCRHYFNISLAMSQFNRQISYILDKHSNNPPVLIQQLFNLLPYQGPEEKKMTQTAILYSMETIHEWQNILYYIDKWQLYSFRKELIKRMRRRLDEEPSQPATDSKEELQRLVDKYWLNHSPKKEENKYKQPIDIRLRAKKVEVSTLPARTQDRQQKAHPSIANKQNIQTTSETMQASNRGTMGQSEVYSTLTGRPAILKKASIFDHGKRGQDFQGVQVKSKGVQEKKDSIEAKGNSRYQEPMEIEITKKSQKPIQKVQPNQKQEKEEEPKNIYKMLTQFCQTASRDRSTLHQPLKKTQSQEINEQPQSNNNNQANEKTNEPYPSVDQFYFGSTKKTKEPQLKKLTISPNKRLSVSNKIIKIRRTEPEPQPHPSQQIYPKEDDFHNDFSFMKDNFQIVKSQPEPAKEHIVDVHANSKRNETAEVSQQRPITIQMPSIAPYQSETPIFLGNPKLVQFLSKQQLKVVEEVSPKYFVKNFLKERGITWMNVFSEKLSKFNDF